LPWLIYGLGQETWPILAPPLALGAMLALAHRTKTRWNALEYGIAAYFALLSVLALAGLNGGLPVRWRFALCPLLLAVFALLSVAVGRPFTLAYAQAWTSLAGQQHPAFFFCNQLISLFWALSFALLAALVVFSHVGATPLSAIVTMYEVFFVSAVFSAAMAGWFHYRHQIRAS